MQFVKLLSIFFSILKISNVLCGFKFSFSRLQIHKFGFINDGEKSLDIPSNRGIV